MADYGSGHGPSDLLRETLIECSAARMSGMLHVSGEPGGTIHLAGGMVAAIQTPGAPSPEVILLRSHRVAESVWDAAFAAASADGGPMHAELLTRARLGAGELEALLRTAVADAMFVLTNGVIAECHAEPGAVDCLLPLEPGARADDLLAEAARRIAVLAALPAAITPDRERVVAVAGVVRTGIRLGQGQDEILALADRRRTARDMAFALGRGVYATLLRLTQMRDAGVLTTASPAAPGEAALANSALANSAVANSAVANSAVANSALAYSGDTTPSRRIAAITRRVIGAEQPGTIAGLPMRRKGRAPLPRRTEEPDGAAEPSTPRRLLQPRSDRPANSGQTA
jgi:hypothetical protein